MKNALASCSIPGVFLSLAVLAAEGPGPASPAGGEPEALRPVPPEQQAELRKKYLIVTLHLKDATEVRGILRSYGKEGTNLFLVSTDKENPLDQEPISDAKVARVEVGEVAREPKGPQGELPPEIAEALRNRRLGQFIAEREAVLKKAASGPEAGREIRSLWIAYGLTGVDRKDIRERLLTAIEGIENPVIRAEMRRSLKDSRHPWGLRPGGPGRGPGSGPGGPKPE